MGKVLPKYLHEINDRFNRQLSILNMENASRMVFYLGNPSSELLAGGIANRPIILNGNKILMKQNKHGFSLDEIKDLPNALREPIAVFNNKEKDCNRSVLIGLTTANGNFLVSIDFDNNQISEFDVISTVFGKRPDTVVGWILDGKMTFVDKERALAYLFRTAPVAGVPDPTGLFTAANVINNFENPKIPRENYERITDVSVRIDKDGRYFMSCRIDGRAQLAERIGGKDAMRLARGLSGKMEIAEKYFSKCMETGTERRMGVRR